VFIGDQRLLEQRLRTPGVYNIRGRRLFESRHLSEVLQYVLLFLS